MSINFGSTSASTPGNVPNNVPSINLTKKSMQKGQVINLTKKFPGLKKVQLGLGWDVNNFSNGIDADLDAVVFLCHDVGNGGTPEYKCLSLHDFIFYYNLCFPYFDPVADLGMNPNEGPQDDRYESAVRDLYNQGKLAMFHAGDNKTGAGDGDDETIFCDLTSLPEDIVKIAFCVTINQPTDEYGRPLTDRNGNPIRINFGSVENAYIRMVNAETGEEIEDANFSLSDDYSLETAVLFSELYRKDGQWRYRAVGEGYNDGLDAMCARYGLNASYN